jgi:prophage regulatory protein
MALLLLLMTGNKMKARILRYSDLEIQLGINRITIWRRTKSDPTFPRPIRLGSGKSKNGATGFLAEEVDAWIEKQSQKRNDGESQ